MSGDIKRNGARGGKRSRLSAEERRGLAIEACATLVATRGYAGTGLRDVAAEAGVSIGTLLHHFATKDDLLASTLVHVSDRFQSDARAAMVSETEPVARLRALVRSVFAGDVQEHGWRVWMAFWYEASLNPRLSHVASQRNVIWESMIATAIADVRRAAGQSLDDVDIEAEELAALLNGVAVQLCAEPDRWSRERALTVADRAVTNLVAS